MQPVIDKSMKDRLLITLGKFEIDITWQDDDGLGIEILKDGVKISEAWGE